MLLSLTFPSHFRPQISGKVYKIHIKVHSMPQLKIPSSQCHQYEANVEGGTAMASLLFSGEQARREIKAFRAVEVL